MSFLSNYWDRLEPRLDEGVNKGDTVAKGFMMPWNHDDSDMDLMLQAFEILRPKVVIELGTFEAFGTMKMADCLEAIGQKAKLYTFDAGIKPYNTLGPTYGTKEDEELVEWDRNFPEKWMRDGWHSWGQVMKARKERLAKPYSNVKVEYIEGITFDTLPKAMKKIGEWDFCFQDTVHYPDLIMKEWELLEPFSKVGSIIVFDNMARPHNTAWVDVFKKLEPNWETRHKIGGCEPLWAERIE